jgi:hypothetical protein
MINFSLGLESRGAVPAPLPQRLEAAATLCLTDLKASHSALPEVRMMFTGFMSRYMILFP